MKLETKIIFIVLMLIFIIGFCLCLNPYPFETMKNMENMEKSSDQCPTLLIRSGNKLFLHNPDQPESENNPIVLNDLDEYEKYIEEQRKNGIRCPVLFLQEESDTQGNTVYRMRDGPTSMTPGAQVHQIPQPQAILDSSRKNPPYNQDQYAGFDAHGQHVGQYTTIDAVHDSTSKNKLSDNPMDTNWGGVEHSKDVILSGKYEDRIVGKPKMVPQAGKFPHSDDFK